MSTLILTSGNTTGAKHYGSFYADGNGALAIQNPSGAGVEDYFKLDTTVVSNGITLISTTEIAVTKTAVYNIQFSAQLSKTTGTADELSIWLDINNMGLDNTNTKLTLANNNQFQVAAWNFMVPINAGEPIRIAWSTSGGHIFLAGEPGIGIAGAIPPVIITVQEV